MHQSVATLDNPEFINLQPLDINPLMSKCEIKVLYTGKNRNKSLMSKDVVTEMAKTLRGAPIVGYYKDTTEDFADHGHQVIIDDEGVKFECKTIPYGFVSPDAKVWFQKFEDTDEFGNVEVREYLMTTGYLWTGQMPDCKRAIEAGNNQSMELDDKTIDGTWSYDAKSNMEFFIVNDAIFSKLCILGENVEPCFEGARVTAPEVSTSFNLDDDFTQTLYSMMQQLNFALQGGQSMKDLETPAVEETVESTEFEAEATVEETPVVEESTETEFAKADDEKDKTDETTSDKKEDNTEEDSNSDASSDSEDDKKKKDFSLEEESTAVEEVEETPEIDYAAKYEELQTEFSALKEQYQQLVEFKNGIELEKKTQLIDSFYMLSEEDKKNVTEHISEFSLDDIEKELSVICVRKKVSFDLEEDSKLDKEEAPVTYSLEEETSVPAWISAVKRTRDSK